MPGEQVYFAVVGLDILDALGALENKAGLIDWIYAQQVVSREWAATQYPHLSPEALAEFPEGELVCVMYAGRGMVHCNPPPPHTHTHPRWCRASCG